MTNTATMRYASYAVAAVTALAMLMAATPAFAFSFYGGSDDITVSNKNSATVNNTTEASASTGGNTSGGSYGGDGANGGDVKAYGGDVDDSTAGNANGGDGDVGGTVISGDAYAKANTTNAVNSNEVKVKIGCGCEDNNGGDVEVKNRNNATVNNTTSATAKTGYNKAKGSSGGNGGNGGDVKAKGWHSDVTGSDAGDADGGNGGEGGYVASGDATAKAYTVNVVNTNLVRVRR